MCAESPVSPSASEEAVTDGSAMLVLRGEFDITSVAFLSARLEQIREQGPRRLVIDLAQVAFLDRAAALVLVSAGQWLPPGTRPVLRHPAPIVRRVLGVSGLASLCEFDLRPGP
ncbi:MAG TPA: STAS domain-containing protein [Trebonia sp.]|jgi:anti-anti-sigma factor|nr:STAS domain-containing protein [Trebonia sp.]